MVQCSGDQVYKEELGEGTVSAFFVAARNVARQHTQQGCRTVRRSLHRQPQWLRDYLAWPTEH